MRMRTGTRTKTGLTILVMLICMTIVFNAGYEESYAFTAKSPFSNVGTYGSVHNDNFKNWVRLNGVDVSYCQSGTGSNWATARNNGVNFSIARVTYTGYSSSKFSYKNNDENFENHYNKGNSAGVLMGAYVFSQAVTTAEAKAEAKYAVTRLKAMGIGPEDLALPIYMDYEFAGYSSGSSIGRMYKAKANGKFTKKIATACAKAFCQTIESYGYDAGIYASLSFFNSYIDSSLGKTYDIWCAQYYKECEYTGTYTKWQYSSSAKIGGINNSSGKTTSVDVNYWYLNPNRTSSSEKDISNCDIKFTAGTNKFTYTGKAIKPSITVSVKQSTLSSGEASGEDMPVQTQTDSDSTIAVSGGGSGTSVDTADSLPDTKASSSVQSDDSDKANSSVQSEEADAADLTVKADDYDASNLSTQHGEGDAEGLTNQSGNFDAANSSAQFDNSGTTNTESQSGQSDAANMSEQFDEDGDAALAESTTTLKNGTDYAVFYVRNISTGTAYAYVKGLGDYTGYKLVPFTISKTTDLESFSLGVNKVAKSAGYSVGSSSVSGVISGSTAGALKSALTIDDDHTVKILTASGSVADSDATVSSENVVAVYNASGTKVGSRTISVSGKASAVTEYTKYKYTGGCRKPKVTVKLGNYTAVSTGTDGGTYADLSYTSSVLPGTYYVTVKGSGIFEGVTAKAKYYVVVKTTSLTKLVNKKTGFRAYWTKQDSKYITGYQVKYCCYSSMPDKYSLIKKYKSYKTSAATIKVNYPGQRYYARIRTYKTIGDKTYYSTWSKKLSVVIK